MEQLNPMKKETVNCRIGSLEKYRKDIRAINLQSYLLVNCRIGSLENNTRYPDLEERVNCRIGSLEMVFLYLPILSEVNCRIGSLERTHPTDSV